MISRSRNTVERSAPPSRRASRRAGARPHRASRARQRPRPAPSDRAAACYDTRWTAPAEPAGGYRMNRLLRIAIPAVLVAGLHAAYVSPVRSDATSDADLWRAAGVSQVPPGTPAPPVILNDLAGKTVDLRDFRGRLVMLYFWVTW